MMPEYWFIVPQLQACGLSFSTPHCTLLIPPPSLSSLVPPPPIPPLSFLHLTLHLCCGTVMICCGSGSGYYFGEVLIPVPAPVSDPDKI
jgi:hypothetical protein